jgi:hypothetical protein
MPFDEFLGFLLQLFLAFTMTLFHPVINLGLEKSQCLIDLMVGYLLVRHPAIDSLLDRM